MTAWSGRQVKHEHKYTRGAVGSVVGASLAINSYATKPIFGLNCDLFPQLGSMDSLFPKPL